MTPSATSHDTRWLLTSGIVAPRCARQDELPVLLRSRAIPRQPDFPRAQRGCKLTTPEFGLPLFEKCSHASAVVVALEARSDRLGRGRERLGAGERSEHALGGGH